MKGPQELETDLRYPIGPFRYEGPGDAARRETWITEIADTPARLRAAVRGLDERQLDTPYREGGWTVRQVAHHVPDSHVNAYVRFRLALTEDRPMIKTYDESLWAKLPDACTAPVEPSLAFLEGLHDRWVRLLRSMSADDFATTFRHPELPGELLPLERMVALYAWHGRHHVAHIQALRTRMGWTG
jgi:hypothetical protein